MITRLGVCSLLAGFFVGVFTGISQFMAAQNFWVDLTISKMIGEDTAESIIGGVNIAIVQDSLDFLIYETPFFCFLLGLGVLLLTIGLFLKNH
ncbi:hypothetical protein [Desulfobacula sp.]|uniref:hypothetical protein n=1 Tax=Desulfobacula sp. TaxID=2593537 RepID=UPI002639AC10|nr:hypothetical protein [Desulfobacula sp.]